MPPVASRWSRRYDRAVANGTAMFGLKIESKVKKKEIVEVSDRIKIGPHGIFLDRMEWMRLI